MTHYVLPDRSQWWSVDTLTMGMWVTVGVPGSFANSLSPYYVLLYE
jgi:hypothetical protein